MRLDGRYSLAGFRSYNRKPFGRCQSPVSSCMFRIACTLTAQYAGLKSIMSALEVASKAAPLTFPDRAREQTLSCPHICGKAYEPQWKDTRRSPSMLRWDGSADFAFQNGKSLPLWGAAGRAESGSTSVPFSWQLQASVHSHPFVASFYKR